MGDVETSPYMQMRIPPLGFQVSSRQPGLTLAKEHCCKESGDRKNEQFHNNKF